MAFRKAAGCLILAAALAAAAQFPARHEHWRNGCEGVITVDERGVSFAGPKDHRWSWKFADIQQLKLAPREIRVLTYEDSRLRPGADRAYDFTGRIPAAELYGFLRGRMDQRLVAEISEPPAASARVLPAKHLTSLGGSQGELSFGPDSIVYATSARRDSRTWRYTDIAGISSSGPFQLTVTTMEKDFNFQLKQPLDETLYNQLWLEIEKKNRRIQ
jgi:hypothetical protein